MIQTLEFNYYARNKQLLIKILCKLIIKFKFNYILKQLLLLVILVLVIVKADSDELAEHDKTSALSSKIQPCIFEFNSTEVAQGEVYSPNYPHLYPNNLNCRYEFYARDNERVIIHVEDFQLEPAQSTAFHDVNFMDFIETITRSNKKETTILSSLSSSASKNEDDDGGNSNRQCFYDFLDVFTTDGQGRLYWRSRHCGNQIDSQIVSTSPTLILVFKTDRMLGFRGFKFRFHFSYLNILPFVTDPICGPSEIVGNGSVLASPNYPLMFPSNTECAWTITVEKHQNILVKFIDVNLNQPCQQSHVSIWDGYVSDITKPDFMVCEKLTYYHKGTLQYKSKTNRLVIKFVGNKNNDQKASNRNQDNSDSPGLQPKSKLDEIGKRANKTVKAKTPKIKNGFFLSWTGIHLADNCEEEFKCKGGEYCIDSKNFLCQQTYRYCISKKLVCDGVYNCDTGDESDEKHCELTFLQSRLYLSIAVIGGSVFILLTFICLVLHKINRKRSKPQIKIEFEEDIPRIGDNNMNKHIQSIMPMPTFVNYNDLTKQPISASPIPPSKLNKKNGRTINKKSFSNLENENNTYKIEYRGLSKNLPNDSNKITHSLQSMNDFDRQKLKFCYAKNGVNNNFNISSNNNSNNSNNNNNNAYRNFSSTTEDASLLNTNNSLSARRVSSPTFSSSLISLPSPAGYDTSTATTNQNLNTRQQNEALNNKSDDSSNTLRRNSYTKAIFFENG